MLSVMEAKERRTAQTNLRLQPSLKARAEKAAVADRRSLTSLIEKVLLEYLEKVEPTAMVEAERPSRSLRPRRSRPKSPNQ